MVPEIDLPLAVPVVSVAGVPVVSPSPLYVLYWRSPATLSKAKAGGRLPSVMV